MKPFINGHNLYHLVQDKSWAPFIILGAVIAWLLIRHAINKLQPLSLREIKPIGYRLPLKTWTRIQDKALVEELLCAPHGSDKNDQMMLRIILLHLMHTFQSKEFGSTFQSPAETPASFPEAPSFSLTIHTYVLYLLGLCLLLAIHRFTGWASITLVILALPIVIPRYFPHYRKNRCTHLQKTIDRVLRFYQAHGHHFDTELKNHVERFRLVVQDRTGASEAIQPSYEKERHTLAALIELFETLKKEVPDYAINGEKRNSGD